MSEILSIETSSPRIFYLQIKNCRSSLRTLDWLRLLVKSLSPRRCKSLFTIDIQRIDRAIVAEPRVVGWQSESILRANTMIDVAPEILENTRHRKYTRAVDVWSLGVVLYICLCGFPPFSDELRTPEHPYNLSQQIKMGRFDYPSPYWDSVGDPALDLIDRMLTVDVDKRISIDECLEHPWIVQRPFNPNDSTDGLAGAMDQLDFSKRKYERERTLLSSINDVKVTEVIQARGENKIPVKVFEKNTDGKRMHAPSPNGAAAANGRPTTEETPAANQKPDVFMKLGGKGDQPLFENDARSRYESDEVPR